MASSLSRASAQENVGWKCAQILDIVERNGWLKKGTAGWIVSRTSGTSPSMIPATEWEYIGVGEKALAMMSTSRNCPSLPHHPLDRALENFFAPGLIPHPRV